MSEGTAGLQSCRKSASIQAFLLAPARGGWMQRQCACGGKEGSGARCEECKKR
jgi:hypothetical protein